MSWSIAIILVLAGTLPEELKTVMLTCKLLVSDRVIVCGLALVNVTPVEVYIFLPNFKPLDMAVPTGAAGSQWSIAGVIEKLKFLW